MAETNPSASPVPIWRRRLNQGWPYIAGIILAPLIWGWFYGNRFLISLQMPLGDPGDLWVDYSHIKGLIQGEWWPFGPRTMHHWGAPFGTVFASDDYPLPEQLQYVVLKILGLFSSNPILVINLYYLLGFILITWAMIYTCRRLRLGADIGLVLGLLLAFLPFHYFRYPHIMLSAYYLVPIAGLLLIWLWSAKPLFTLKNAPAPWWSRLDRKSWFALAACILIGWWHVYYAFFFCFFAVIAGFSAAFYRRSQRPAISAAIMIGLVTLALGIAMLPTFAGQMLHGKNPEVASRTSYESEIYGLNLMHLIVPAPGHRWPALRALRDRYQSGTPAAEGSWEYIGLAGVLGLVGSLLGFWVMRGRGSLGLKLSVLTTAGILYATIGGFSSAFALLVTPMIRCPNRISPYLAFFALLWVGWLLKKASLFVRPRWIFYAGLSGLLIAGIADQINPQMVTYNLKDELWSDKTFIYQIEARVPQGAILQLPYLPFPESPPKVDMTDYSPLRGYLFSRHLDWSYGAFHGRPAAKKIEILSREPLNVAGLRAVGYKGVYIDRFGYPGHHAAAEAQLARDLKQTPLESPNKRFCFFKL